MLSEEALKQCLQNDITRADKILATISSFSKPVSSIDIKKRAKALGCNMDGWDIASILSKAAGQALKLPTGYEVAEKGKARLSQLGISKHNPEAAKVASDLRAHLPKIKNKDTRSFVEEAVLCYENGLYRSSIVMSWLAAVDVLQNEVIKNHLAAFNKAASASDAKWRSASNTDDLGRMKEYDFLDRISGISMIGKNVKEELQKALKLRNGCGHPNSLRVSSNMAASHIELLLLNVFDKFSN